RSRPPPQVDVACRLEREAVPCPRLPLPRRLALQRAGDAALRPGPTVDGPSAVDRQVPGEAPGGVGTTADCNGANSTEDTSFLRFYRNIARKPSAMYPANVANRREIAGSDICRTRSELLRALVPRGPAVRRCGFRSQPLPRPRTGVLAVRHTRRPRGGTPLHRLCAAERRTHAHQGPTPTRVRWTGSAGGVLRAVRRRTSSTRQPVRVRGCHPAIGLPLKAAFRRSGRTSGTVCAPGGYRSDRDSRALCPRPVSVDLVHPACAQDALASGLLAGNLGLGPVGRVWR